MLILRSPMLACARFWPTEVEITSFAGLVARTHAVGGRFGGPPIRAADNIAGLALAVESLPRRAEEGALRALLKRSRVAGHGRTEALCGRRQSGGYHHCRHNYG